jgi:2-methylcitrate dehydratase PrpD
MSELVQKAGRWVADLRWDDVPADVQTSIRDGVLQSVAGGVAGFNMPEVEIALRLLHGDESGPSTVFVAGNKVPRATAAYLNSVMFSSLEQQEMHVPSASHPLEVIVPAALAISETRPVTGTDFLLAVLVGVEINIAFGVISEEVLPLVLPNAAMNTSLYGGIGTAATVSKLLGSDAETVGVALCHAANLGAGLNQCLWGATTEYHHALGNGTRVGLLAAELAAAGQEATSTTFEGPSGFYHRHAELTPERIAELDLPHRVGDALGNPWRMTEHLYKRYPVHYNNMPYIDAAKALRAAHAIDPSEVEAIRIRINDWCLLCDGGNLGPYHGLEATRGATAYGVAAMLSRGRFGLSDIDNYDAPDIMGLVAKTEISTYEDDPVAAGDWRSHHVEIDARGETFIWDSEVDGVPDYRLQLEELTAIAQDALSRVLPEAQTARVLEVLASLPELDDVASSLVPHLIAHA